MSWDDTIATLLMGTERRPGSPEPELLRTAALETTRRRAGATVGHTDFRLTHAPPETSPECTATAGQLLDLVVIDHFGQGSRDPLTAMWVAGCAAAGQIAPARLVPTLLEFGKSHVAARPDLRIVVGERGRWMASLGSSWPWVGSATTDDEDDAPLDLIAARLREARRSDPDAGRDRIIAAVGGLAAADRALLYGSLSTGLSDDDEPLLESLLDERSQKIRATAADLLARLPESAWARRMIGRVEPLVIKRRRKNRFQVDLPEALDEDAIRDGIVEKPPKGTGKQAWWLIQIVAGVPLSWWERSFDADAAKLAPLAPIAEVRTGWVEAARRHSDQGWAGALFDAKPDAGLLAVLDDAAAGERLIGVCHEVRPLRKGVGLQQLARMLGEGPDRWSPELSAAVADVIAAVNPKATQGLGQIMAILDRADPSVVDRLADAARDLSDHWRSQIRIPISRISFRAAIDQEFT